MKVFFRVELVQHTGQSAEFEKHIGKDARATTDGWRGYNPITKDYDIKQVPSNKGRNFKELHTVIGQIGLATKT